MFRAMFSPIINSNWLYLEHLEIFTNVAAGWCHGWVGTWVPTHPWHQPAATLVNITRGCVMDELELEFQLIYDTSRQRHWWILPEAVSWMSWNWRSNSTTPPSGPDTGEYYHRLCHGWVGTRVPTHPWHQPAATLVNITRCCKYSQLLLMMGENIARNMQSWPGIINLPI
jgi:hypothetical protein